MSHYEAKLDGSYQNSAEVWLPLQMSLLSHLVIFHWETGMLQNPATVALSLKKPLATMHLL